MRFTPVNVDGTKRLLIQSGDMEIFAHEFFPQAPQNWNALIGWLHNNYNDVKAKLSGAAKATPAYANNNHAIPAEDSTRIICAGLNFTDHAEEGNLPIPEFPVFFTRYPQSFTAQGKPLVAPKVSKYFDYEVELVIVIGQKCRHVAKDKALDVVFGYTVAMDGSLRDLQKRSVQWTLGKNADDSGSLGPSILHKCELPEGAKGLKIQAKVNGELLQNGNSADMIFDVATLISTLSSCMTLLPGDLILTGTPAGVGFARDPAIYLKAGDTVEVSVEKVGTLTNNVIDES